MTPADYLSFLAIAVVVVLVPGPDFAVVTRNTVVGGRARGWATAAGVASACAVQGTAAVGGLGALIVASQPLFNTLRWAGVAYLAYLAAQSFRSAWRGHYTLPTGGTGSGRGFTQGFLSSITNPKLLVFYLAILPQFMGDGRWTTLALLALTHAVVGLGYLLILAAALHRARGWLSQRRVRRTLDLATGTALGAFSVGLAWERL